MIKKITIMNYLGESMDMELMNPESSGFIIDSINGLGPPKINLYTSELVTTDGALVTLARVTPRNITMTLEYLPKPTIEETRLLTYKFFSIKKPITIKIETDTRSCITTGYVESNEPNIFDEHSGCSISILCPDAFFYSAEITTVTYQGVKSLFTFPYENVGTEANTELGSIIEKQEQNIVYDGDTDVGITIKIKAIGIVKGLLIYDIQRKKMLSINDEIYKSIAGNYISNGDEITISSVRGSKYAILLKDGRHYNILNSLGKKVNWFELSKGNNIFAFMAEEGKENLQFEIQYRVAYVGV